MFLELISKVMYFPIKYSRRNSLSYMQSVAESLDTPFLSLRFEYEVGVSPSSTYFRPHVCVCVCVCMCVQGVPRVSYVLTNLIGGPKF